MDYTQAATIIQKKFREFKQSKMGNLTKEQKAFIRPWVKRWKTKSIFQVLLLYRADRLQVFVNFCLQVHIFNQSALNQIQKTNIQVNLEDIDLSVSPTHCIPSMQLTAYKVPFVRESFIQKSDVSNCEPLPDCDLEILKSEIAMKIWKQMNKQTTSLEPVKQEDKEVQTLKESISPVKEEKLDGNDNRNFGVVDSKEDAERPEKMESDMIENEKELKNKEKEQDEIVPKKDENIKKELVQYSLNKKETKEKKESLIKNEETEDIKNKNKEKENIKNGNKEKVHIKNENEEKHIHIQIIQEKEDEKKEKNKIVQQLNKEENEGKDETPKVRLKTSKTLPPSLKPQQNYSTSIKELEEKFRQTENTAEDDPPFNFRALLRKTSYPTISHSKEEDHKNAFGSEFLKEFDQKRKSMERRQSSTVVTEIAPGILIHGKVADL